MSMRMRVALLCGGAFGLYGSLSLVSVAKELSHVGILGLSNVFFVGTAAAIMAFMGLGLIVLGLCEVS